MDEPADFCTNPPLSPGGFVQGQVSKLPINCQEMPVSRPVRPSRRSNHSLTTVSRRRKYQQRSIYSDPTPLMHAVRADQPQVVRFSTGVVCGG
ncbi:hypothetical protein ACO22_05863 [Paracoccidioides brasiliensis]|uniref:Uncharacterized protein n=1 Tax=Paracoccidioides brasiliensis TaxID=121759 RepID=A0A1D2J9C0_PARBR|nr:hypothetical protein ACO22_05863 [Paracoccidioides brasiliensis]